MNEQLRATIESLMRRQAQNGSLEAARAYQRYLTGDAPLPPYLMEQVVNELRRQNIDPASVFGGAGGGAGAGQGGIAEAVQAGDKPLPQGTTPNAGPEIGDVPGAMPALNSGTGDNSLASKIAAAARAGASAAGGAGAVGAGYQERGPGYGPGPSGTIQQRGPGGANTLGTAFMKESGSPGATANTGAGFTASQDDNVARDDNRLFRLAMVAAGLNPDRLTSFSKNAGRALLPLLQARRAAFGIGANSAGGLAQDIVDFAKGYTSGGGGNFFQGARDYASQVMNSDNFKNAIAGLSDQDSVAQMYQSLMPLQYAGSNPLLQQAAADTFERTFARYGDEDFASNGNAGIFNDWLAKQQRDPIINRIFGLR